MQIIKMVIDILENRNNEDVLILHDYLEEYCYDHSERTEYMKRLSGGMDKLRLHTVIDIVCKFGGSKERRIMQKVIRRVLEKVCHNKKQKAMQRLAAKKMTVCRMKHTNACLLREAINQ